MGITPVPVDPRHSLYDQMRPCARAHVSAVVYIRAGIVVGIPLGIMIGYGLAHLGV